MIDFSLRTACARFPTIDVADESMNEDLLDFASNIEMVASGLGLQYLRGPNYFRYLTFQSLYHQVCYMRINNKIVGTASVSIRPSYLDGLLEWVAYWSDLRMDTSVNGTRLWREFCGQAIRTCMEEFGIRYNTMAVLDKNIAISKALHDGLPSGISTDILYQYHIVQLLSPLPWRRKPQIPFGYELLTGSQIEEADLIGFLEKKNINKQFGYCFKDTEWTHRQSHWGFELSKFRVWIDRNHKVVACCLPWEPSQAKDIRIVNLPTKLRLLANTANVMSRHYGVANAQMGKSFCPLYLTHLEFDNEMTADLQKILFKGLIENIFQDFLQMYPGRWNGISFMDTHKHHLSNALGGYLLQNTPARLLNLRISEIPEPKVAIDSNNLHIPIAFETALA